VILSRLRLGGKVTGCLVRSHGGSRRWACGGEATTGSRGDFRFSICFRLATLQLHGGGAELSTQDDRRHEWEEGKRKGGHILASLHIDKFPQLGGNNQIVFMFRRRGFLDSLQKYTRPSIHKTLEKGLAKLREKRSGKTRLNWGDSECFVNRDCKNSVLRKLHLLKVNI